MKVLYALCALCLVVLSSAKRHYTQVDPRVIEPPTRVDLQPPEAYSLNRQTIVYQTYMTVPLDHFDPLNKETFQMRYMFNQGEFGGEGYPIFIMVGGEWEISTSYLVGGNMFENAKENRGFIIYTEHRFYGQTQPFSTTTVENLKYLNVDQAIADLGYFIIELKKQSLFANSKVVLYGGSYAGNMVMWFKQRYPHLVVGTVASSAPIRAEVDFTGYLEVVHDAFLSEGGQACIDVIRQGIADSAAAMQSVEGWESVADAFRLCPQIPLNYTDKYQLGYIAGLISWTFSSEVQYASPGQIIATCNNFLTNQYGTTPMEKIGGYIAAFRNLNPASCWNIQYDAYLASYQTGLSAGRHWYYQTCTEYGFFQTAPRIGTVFDPLIWLDVDFYADMCRQAFDPKFDEEFILNAAKVVNTKYGDIYPDVNNTINIHGSIDPWRYLGQYENDINESSPTYVVDRASHCFDLRAWSTSDTIMMTKIQQAARNHVNSWL